MESFNTLCLVHFTYAHAVEPLQDMNSTQTSGTTAKIAIGGSLHVQSFICTSLIPATWLLSYSTLPLET